MQIITKKNQAEDMLSIELISRDKHHSVLFEGDFEHPDISDVLNINKLLLAAYEAGIAGEALEIIDSNFDE